MLNTISEALTKALVDGYLPISSGTSSRARTLEILGASTSMEQTNHTLALDELFGSIAPAEWSESMARKARNMLGVTITRYTTASWTRLRDTIAQKLDGTQAAIAQEIARLNACPLEPFRLVPKRLTRQGDEYAAVLAGTINAVRTIEDMLDNPMAQADKKILREFGALLVPMMQTIMKRSLLAVSQGASASIYFERVADGAWYGRGIRGDLRYWEQMALLSGYYPFVNALQQYAVAHGVVDNIRPHDPIFMTGGMTTYVIQPKGGSLLSFASQKDMTSAPAERVFRRDPEAATKPAQLDVAHLHRDNPPMTIAEGAAWIVPTQGKIGIGEDVFAAGGLLLALPDRAFPLTINAKTPMATALIVTPLA